MRKKRIAILSSGGDIFLSSLVLKLFKERFYDEIDEMFVCYNNHAQIPLSVAQEFIKNVMEEPKARIVYYPMGVGNGVPIKQGVLLAPDDSLILLLEDDSYCFTPGVIDAQFKRIESGEVDAVGSPRFSCGEEIAIALKANYNLEYSGYGDRGPFHWPSFYFGKREDFLKTDLNFGSKEYEEGVFYKEMNRSLEKTEHTDTFGWAHMQMRHNGVRFGEVDQFHCSPTEMADKRTGMGNWYKGKIPFWFHAGSLSAGWNGYLNTSTPDTSTDMAKMEMETRCAWWQIASDLTEGFDSFKKEYKDGIISLISRAKLENSRVQEKYNLYRGMLKM